MRQGSAVARRRSLFGMLARGVLFAGLALALTFTGLVALYAVAPPVSTLMLARTILGKSYVRVYVPLSEVAPVAAASVIASEDATFCRNHGVDWGALREVLRGAGRPHARRLDDHHADGEEPLSLARPFGPSQGRGDPHGARPRPGLVEGAHHRDLPQHRRMG